MDRLLGRVEMLDYVARDVVFGGEVVLDLDAIDRQDRVRHAGRLVRAELTLDEHLLELGGVVLRPAPARR